MCRAVADIGSYRAGEGDRERSPGEEMNKQTTYSPDGYTKTILTLIAFLLCVLCLRGTGPATAQVQQSNSLTPVRVEVTNWPGK